jgi:multiple sugar transport system substrate-binding protein
MSSPRCHSFLDRSVNRRRAIGTGLGAAAALGLRGRFAHAQGIDAETWSPDAIRAMAGTLEVDTAADLAALVPADYAGETSFWYVGPTEATSQLEIQIHDEMWQAWSTYYPNIPLVQGETALNVGYNDLLDKIRTAATGGAAPAVARLPILWGSEFAGRGQLREINLADYGYTEENFWPGALKSVRFEDKIYGIPTNNETMAFIWNAEIFEAAGLDPDTAPATWDEVVTFSKQIKDATGKAGFGLVARVNAGNTPFRFMPMAWAYGGGALDEAEAEPTFQNIMINNEGTVQALQLAYDMYVRDKSVPASALTNTQTENGDLFIAGEVAMMISHPSEYGSMQKKAAEATGADKEYADRVVANMRYGMIPEGPVRRAVVFGGSNIHIFTDEAHGGEVDLDAAKALVAMQTMPEWSTKNAWLGSNPGNLDGFKTTWMKERLDTIPFLENTTSMLPYGIPFPVIPEANSIMNEIVPNMLQNALTETMSVKDAADNAAAEIEGLLGGGY